MSSRKPKQRCWTLSRRLDYIIKALMSLPIRTFEMEARVRRTLTQALNSDVSQENITEVTFFFFVAGLGDRRPLPTRSRRDFCRENSVGHGDGRAGQTRAGGATGSKELDNRGSRRRQRELIYLFIRLQKKEKESAHGTDGPSWNFLNPLVSHQRPTLEKYFASNCAAEVFLSSPL